MKRTMAMAGAAVALLAWTAPMAVAGAPTARGYPILHMSTRSGNAGLYILNGTMSVRIARVDSPGHDCGPAFRRDGRKVAFESNRLTPEGYSSNNFEIYTFDLKTNKLTRITRHDGADLFPAWSPDGRKIAFSREETPQAAGYPAPATGEGSPAPIISIWLMNADGSGLTQLTQADVRYAHIAPAWSPDGRRIAFSVADTVAANPSSIAVMNADGSNLKTLTTDGDFPDWSPDGKHIAFSSERGQSSPLEHDLFVMRADGSGQRSVGHRDGADIMPSWSPDGRRLAYAHDPDGWSGVAMTKVTPDGTGYDFFASGPEHANIWQLRLDGSNHGFGHEQLSDGEEDLFPRYAPVAYKG